MVETDKVARFRQDGEREPLTLVYDGECPFCSAYARMVRLQRSFGTVRLVDARSGDPVVGQIQSAGFDLNRGMVLKVDNELYCGETCVHMIALMSTPSGLFNRITKAVFTSPRLARSIYPMLVAGRNASLFLLGRQKIKAATKRQR